MAGIYIHIPFCKQACHYCNFHFSTILKNKSSLIDALIREIELRKHYLSGREIESIYFGGGTPSLLDSIDLERIIYSLKTFFHWNQDCEITLEANPDDINKEKLIAYKNLGINRLSIGIQSFCDQDLQFMNRSHNAKQASQSIDQALNTGFKNLNIDLIFGLPTLTDRAWEENLNCFIDFDIPHLSCYALTIEPKTVFYHRIQKNKMPDLNQGKVAHQLLLARKILFDHGYDHYEISNYAKANRYAIHNTNYWKGIHYLGLGPSAHSYNGRSRQWNIANNAKYIKAISRGDTFFQIESLGETDHYNEYILTHLRTKWGCRYSDLKKMKNKYIHHFKDIIFAKMKEGFIKENHDSFILTEKGLLFADQITADLFFDS